MGTLQELDASLVSWLNQALGSSPALDYLVYLLVSDYLAPVAMSLWLLGLWFTGSGPEQREGRQRGVLRAALALGFAALMVVMSNHLGFRERPFVHLEVTNLLYAPTDSSFPANAAAVSLALAAGIWPAHRPSGLVLLALAVLWGLSRVISGVYYPSDVLAGAGVGALAAIAAGQVLRWLEPIPAWLLQLGRFLHLA